MAIPSGECNFHIFYYFIAGASLEERQHLHLQEKMQYTDTLASMALVPAQSVSETMTHQFEQLKVTLKTISLSKQHVAQTCQLIISTILHSQQSQMEREMCHYSMEWELNVDLAMLKEFEEMVCKDFVGPGPYLTYTILPPTKKLSPPPTTIPFTATSCGISPSLSNKQWYQSPPKTHYLPPSMPQFSSPPETPLLPTYSTLSPTSPASPHPNWH